MPALGDDPVEDGDGAVGVDPPLDLDGERLAGVLVDDVQQLQDPAVAGRVELEVERPHLVWPLGPQPPRRDGRDAEPLPLALPRRRARPRQSRCTFFRFACQPASRSDAHAFR
ncbi:MAG: hypothetical protein WKF65_10650 [Gaiellaceae bacterium]